MNITVTWTNGRKFTHMHGRQSRPQFIRKAGQRAILEHKCKRVCLLTEAEAELMECRGLNFPCHNAGRPHRHYTRASVERLVDKGEARWVGKGKNVATPVRPKTWQPLMSGDMNVMQMVPGGVVY
jgi:hypothetical protein